MPIICEKYANVKPLEDFDWSLYDGGWNGKSLHSNNRVKTKKGEKVYCHEKYAQKLYNKYSGITNEDLAVSKDLREGDVFLIKDVCLTGKDELILSTSAGGSVIVNLSKENKFFEMHGMTKEEFKEGMFGTTAGRQSFVNQGYIARVEKSGKASLYDGILIKTEMEFKEQIALGDKANRAYRGKIVGSNRGGFIIEIQGIKCFLPGSQATANKVNDFESLVGTETEVMIMSYVEGKGFLVSRKKYLDKVRPQMIMNLRESWEKNPERIYRGTVTGAKHFGIFVELNEFYTGLLHKTYVMPEDYEKLKGTDENPDGNARMNFTPGTEIDVKIYSISDDNSRIILTNILDKEMRDVVVDARVKAEEEEEAKRKEEELKAKEEKEKAEAKAFAQKAAKNFKNEVVSLDDLSELANL